MLRLLIKRSGEVVRSHWWVFGLLVVWTVAPLIPLVIHVARHGGVLTGANSADPFDQFQYLAWIRDEGSHLFASNLWATNLTSHDYVQPMYLISGLLWRLGVGIQLAYLLWKPIALLVLFLGFAAYVRHLLPASHWQQAGALILALFYITPVYPLAAWTGYLSPSHQLQLIFATDDASAALNLWGLEHAAIAIGLMPVFLIAAEMLLAERTGSAHRRAWSGLAAVAGLLIAWLHPWQAVTLLAVLGGMLVLRAPRKRYLRLIPPVVATLLPLIYGILLSRYDPSWRFFQMEISGIGTAPWWALLASFGPLVALAALGVRRPTDDRDWMLLLWLVACAGVYFVVPEFPPHALSGVTLPLGVLAVRGWQRARIPQRAAVPAAAIALLTATLPAAIYHAQDSYNELAPNLAGALTIQLLRLTANQAAALHYLDRTPRRGGVLAPPLLSMSVPEFTGRDAYAGHQNWQPPSQVATANLFFSPTLKDPGGRLRQTILRRIKVAFVLADCGAPAKLATYIALVVRVVKRFGCAAVYQTK